MVSGTSLRTERGSNSHRGWAAGGRASENGQQGPSDQDNSASLVPEGPWAQTVSTPANESRNLRPEDPPKCAWFLGTSAQCWRAGRQEGMPTEAEFPTIWSGWGGAH